MRVAALLLALAIQAAIVETSWAQSSLTLGEALQRAEANLPLPQAARAKVLAAEARTQLAGKQNNTNIALARPYGSSQTGGFGEDIIVSQTFEPGGVLRPRKQAAEQQQKATEADQVATLLDLRRDVTSAYIECLRADAELAQAKSSLEATQRFAEAASAQFTAGDVPRSNVVRSQIENARFRQTLTQATTDRDNRYSTLKSLLGLPSDASLVLAGALTAKTNLPNLATAQSLALSRRPDILAARAQVLASSAGIAEAKGQRLPNVVLEGRRYNLNPAQVGDASLRIGINLPLFDNGRIRAEVRATEAAKQEMQLQLKETERLALLEVEIALRECQQALQIAASFEGEGRLTKTKELLEMAQIGYEKGGSGYLEVIDAQRTFASEQVEYLRALATLQLASAQLERTIGGPLP
ncbi:TolC family protein [Armatimonas sp.]|uniref:TolC family protein n=1 Tax=Armatimonas sp. TaxID=1872638 RepID=UPI00286BE4AA|nr:TolC family protein [Armatimonas sp.]